MLLCEVYAIIWNSIDLIGVEGDEEEIEEEEEEGNEDGSNEEDYLKAEQARLEENKKALLENQNIMAEVGFSL